MTSRRAVGVGILGAGFLAAARVRAYRRIPGPGRVVAVASRTADRAQAFAREHGVPDACSSAQELLEREDVDAVDLCVPNLLHRPLAEQALRAGKHVICTKPLAAYVGQDLGEQAAAEQVSAADRARMRRVAVADAEAMVAAAEGAGLFLMYAENWVYAPSVQKADSLLAQAGGPILEMRGWECHSGSHSPYSKVWRHAGGGALLRLGAHPIGAMLHLKRREGLRRAGRPIRVKRICADVSDLTAVHGLDASRSALATGFEDVETFGCVLMEFEDGARGVAIGSDNLLGGMESQLTLLAPTCHLRCNLSPNDLLRAYASGEGVFGDEYLMEKLGTRSGWSTPMPSEDFTSGHVAMLEDFVRAVAEGRPPLADGALGRDVTEVVYAAYESVEQGRRIELD